MLGAHRVGSAMPNFTGLDPRLATTSVQDGCLSGQPCCLAAGRTVATTTGDCAIDSSLPSGLWPPATAATRPGQSEESGIQTSGLPTLVVFPAASACATWSEGLAVPVLSVQAPFTGPLESSFTESATCRMAGAISGLVVTESVDVDVH